MDQAASTRLLTSPVNVRFLHLISKSELSSNSLLACVLLLSVLMLHCCTCAFVWVFVYYAEVTSLISPWEKPGAICEIPLNKNKSKSNLVSHIHTQTHKHRQAHTGTYTTSTHTSTRHVCWGKATYCQGWNTCGRVFAKQSLRMHVERLLNGC